MQPLITTLGTTAVVIANAATSMPFPPIVRGGNVSAWNGARNSVSRGLSVPEFTLKIWSTASVDLTAAELWAGSLHAGTIVADDVEGVTAGSDLMTIVAHGLHTGDGPVRMTTSGVLPAGLALATDYYVIRLSADTFALATSLANALAGTVIDITGAGTGTHTITGSSTTYGAHYRMHFQSAGVLGTYGDGAISLTSRKAYRVIVPHDPDTVMYSLSATLSVGNPVYASAYARQS